MDRILLGGCGSQREADLRDASQDLPQG